MNIQKISMRPVICLLLVMLLVMAFFSVSAFADELVSAEGIDSYSSDVIYSIAKVFVPGFTIGDAHDVYDYPGFHFDVSSLLYMDSTGSILIAESDLDSFVSFLDYNGYDASIDIYEFFDNSTYFVDKYNTCYYPFSCSSDAVVLSGSQVDLTEIPGPGPEPTGPAETEAPVVPSPVVPDSTLSQAVSSNTISSVLNQVLDLLPVALSCIIGFIAIRKGLSFLESILHSA